MTNNEQVLKRFQNSGIDSSHTVPVLSVLLIIPGILLIALMCLVYLSDVSKLFSKIYGCVPTAVHCRLSSED